MTLFKLSKPSADPAELARRSGCGGSHRDEEAAIALSGAETRWSASRKQRVENGRKRNAQPLRDRASTDPLRTHPRHQVPPKHLCRPPDHLTQLAGPGGHPLVV